MAAAGGDYAAPAIRLRWYNLSSGRVEIAEVPGFAFTVTGSPAAAGSGGLSPRSLGVAAVLLIAAAAASWFAFRLAPVVRAYRRRRHEAWLRSEPCAFGNLAAAVRARDYGGTIAALDVWTRRLPAAADREDKALAAALRTLGRNIYGSAPVAPTQAEWSAVAVALAAARRSRNARRLEARSAAMLPPLNPGHTA